MNDYSVQRVSELMRGVIELLWTRPEGLPGKDVISRLPTIIQLTESETALSATLHLPNYEHAVRLAMLPLVKVGWVVKTEKGRWFISEDGRDACRRFSRPQDLYIEALRLAESSQKNIPDILVSLELIKENAWNDVAYYLQEKNTVEIRRLVAVLFEALQYNITWIAPPQKKHGLIDMVANIDPIGAKVPRIIVQVKHTGQPVTVEGLKSFSSILGTNDFGLLFSTGGFTTDVRGLLNKGGNQKINAMDLEKFYDVWIRHYDKLSLEAHSLLPLKAIFFLAPPG
jgi:restriction system protein